MRARYFTSSVFIFLTTSLILGLSAPVAAQDGETDRIRILIFGSDESNSGPIDLNLPAGEWEFAPLAFAEEGSQYSYSSRQGPNAIESTYCRAPANRRETATYASCRNRARS